MSSSNIVRRQSYTPAIEDDQGAECRRLCAFNIPAMMLFADHLKETSKVIEIVRLLSADQHDKVRRTLACGFHEVVSILGDKSHVITKDLGTLLQDNNPDVLLALLEHFPEIIDNFIQAHNLDIKTRQPGLLELIQPLLHLEQVASTSRQWRLHCMYLENMSCLAYCMTSDQLYYKFVPLCWKCISKNVSIIMSTFNVMPIHSIYPSTHSLIHPPFTHPSICLPFTHPFIHPFTHPFIHLSIHPSI
jgi:serine/threonine-protein phosphatase 4 regulatory subunit 4